MTEQPRHHTGPPEVWGLGDIRARLRVAHTTVNKWRARDSFPPSGKVNGRTEVWDPSEVLAWVQENAGVKAIAARARALAEKQAG